MPGAAFGPKRICALRLMRLAVKEMVICPAAGLEGSYLDMDLLLVCGGLRTPLKDTPGLSRLLQLADERGIALAGLWMAPGSSARLACWMGTNALCTRKIALR